MQAKPPCGRATKPRLHWRLLVWTFPVFLSIAQATRLEDDVRDLLGNVPELGNFSLPMLIFFMVAMYLLRGVMLFYPGRRMGGRHVRLRAATVLQHALGAAMAMFLPRASTEQLEEFIGNRCVPSSTCCFLESL